MTTARRHTFISTTFLLLFSLCSSGQTFKLTDTVFHNGDIYTDYGEYFDLAKWTIKPESYPRLDSIADFLLKHKKLVVEVGGHTDSRSKYSETMSVSLTLKRAQSIVEYLATKGIDVQRLVAKGYDKTKPIVWDNEIEKLKTEEKKEAAHKKNRRIEFKIIQTGEEVLTEEDAKVSIKINDVFKGYLYWNFNCTLERNASRSIIDSIVTTLNNQAFDSCLIKCVSYHLREESMHCGYTKAKEIKNELVNNGISENVIRVLGEAIITDKAPRPRTEVYIMTYSHNQQKKNLSTKVTAYLNNKTTNSLAFYDTINGQRYDKLIIPKADLSWVLVMIDTIVGDWFHLNYIRYEPNPDNFGISKFNGAWTKNAKLYFDLHNDSTTIYSQPNKQTILAQVAFQVVKVVEVNNGWAKVEFKYDGKRRKGWIYTDDQCPYPWTTCN